MRQIDIKARALTSEEKGWLEQRDRHADIAENDRLFPYEEEEDLDDEDDSEADVAPDPYADQTTADLVKIAKSRGIVLPSRGRKADVIALLREYDAANPAE